MATKRIKDISTTATTFAADDFIALDASSVGTRKMAKASLISQVGANYLEKADNLSDVADKDTSKLNLEVPNVGTAANEVPTNGQLGNMSFQNSEAVTVDDLTVDGHFTAAVGKPMPVNGPSMRFDGVDDYVEFAAPVGSVFDFTNGTDDLPLTAAGWLYVEDASVTQYVLGKWGSGSSTQHWLLATGTSGQLRFLLNHGATTVVAQTDPVFEAGKWYHVCASYAGSGPNSTHPFSQAASHAVALYVNGKPLAVSAIGSNNTGMITSAQQVRIMLASIVYTKGQIRDVKLFNKELSAAEVKEVFSNGQLPESFAESTGTADVVTDGGFENWNTSTDLTNWSEGSAVSVAQSTDKISGTYSCKITGGGDIGSSGNNWLLQNTVIYNANKKYRLTGKVKRFSGSTNVLQFGALYYQIIQFNGTTFSPASTSTQLPFIGAVTSKDLGNDWYSFSVDFTTTVATTLTIGVNGSTDPYLVDDVSLVQIGSVLDARAEQFDSSTGKLYDLSGNDFVGTQSGGVSLLGREFPVYETGTWNGVYSPYTGSFATMTMDTSLVYTRIGNLVTVTGFLQTDNVDTTGGSGQLQITGLPFAASVVSTCHIGFAFSWGSATPLTGAVIGSAIRLYTRASTTGNTNTFDVSNLSAGALANRNTIYISATYQIS